MRGGRTAGKGKERGRREGRVPTSRRGKKRGGMKGEGKVSPQT